MHTLQKLIILFICLITYATTLSGQGWIRSRPGGIAITTQDGNFLGLGNDITKADPDANLIWSISLDSSIYKTDTTKAYALHHAYEKTNGHFMVIGRVLHFHSNTSNANNIDFNNGYISEVSETGDIIWEKEIEIDNLTTFDSPEFILPVEGGSLLFGLTKFLNEEGFVEDVKMLLLKIDENGNLLSRTHISSPEESVKVKTPNAMIALSDSTFMLMGTYREGFYGHKVVLIQINQDGEVLSEYLYENYAQTGYGSSFSTIVQTPDGGFVLGNPIQDSISLPENQFVFDVKLMKVNAEGGILWTDTIPKSALDDIVVSPDGETVILVRKRTYTEKAFDILLRKYKSSGEIEWSREIGGGGDDTARSLVLHPDGGYIFTGIDGKFDLLTGLPVGGTAPSWLKTDSLGIIYSNNINGNIFEDFDLDCQYNGEEGFPHWIIGMETAGEVDFEITNNDGYYEFSVAEGEYTLLINNKAPYWDGCNDPFTTEVMAYDTVMTNLGQQANVDCPYLEVDISTPFLRRCFENTYTVFYCNKGTAPAEDAYVEVSLDSLLTYVSSTIPLVSNNNNVFTFDLGDVDMNACGDFKITVFVDCDNTLLGQTHCTTAHIYPDEICIPSPLWSGASVDVNANCLGDSIQFLITNVGDAPTSSILDFFIVEDQVILLQGNFPETPPGESQSVIIPSTGGTFRMEVEQEPNHPGSNMPTVTVEGCSLGDDISLGYVTQYWENDGDSFVSIDCQENIGSFDPNDKRAYPKGFGEEHFIDKNQDIEYHIRFQNTGSDTAFTVIVRDPISEFLDITSIVPGASSHPYEMDIVDGRVLKFTFPTINLLDSLNHEAESHGFIKFKIKQIPNLIDGIVIENKAAIVFDFNDAVITNTTFHTIGGEYITSIYESEQAEEEYDLVQAHPNPFIEQTHIQLDLTVGQLPIILSVFDALGRKIREDFYPTNRIIFDRKELPKGIYFFKILSKEKAFKQGKFIIQ